MFLIRATGKRTISVRDLVTLGRRRYLTGHPDVALTSPKVDTNPTPVMSVLGIFQSGGVLTVSALFSPFPVARRIVADGLYIWANLFE